MSDGSSGSRQRRKSNASQIAQAYRTAHEIISAAVAMSVMVGGGYWLDHKFGWTPAMTVCGACLGFVAAGASLRVLLRRLDQESARKRADDLKKRESQSLE
jgi:F0F1-type ATP synthase assembly protein I